MSISTNLRNRIVGLLVVLSVILILSPMFMSNEKSSDSKKSEDSAIAINQNGAVTDSSGQLVAAAEHDYSEMLEAPVDDLKNEVSDPLSLSENAPKASSPFDALGTQNGNNTFVQNTLETAVPSNERLVEENIYVAPESVASDTIADNSVSKDNGSIRTETLHSNRQSNSENVKKPAVQPQSQVSKTTLVSGTFAAQMGVFSKKANAQGLLTKLKNAGFKAVTQSVNINGKSVIRVIAGTSKSRAGAEQICKNATARTGEKCTILSL
ncbi:MAG: SPOR domain-containing protein [Succinivibrio sp.]